MSSCTARMRDVLTAMEIRTSGLGAKNAYEAIAELRPEFLRVTPTLGNAVAGRPDLRINDVPAGDLEWLRAIPANTVAEIRFVRAVDTVLLYGARYPAGLLMVRLK